MNDLAEAKFNKVFIKELKIVVTNYKEGMINSDELACFIIDLIEKYKV